MPKKGKKGGKKGGGGGKKKKSSKDGFSMNEIILMKLLKLYNIYCQELNATNCETVVSALKECIEDDKDLTKVLIKPNEPKESKKAPPADDDVLVSSNAELVDNRNVYRNVISFSFSFISLSDYILIRFFYSFNFKDSTRASNESIQRGSI